MSAKHDKVCCNYPDLREAICRHLHQNVNVVTPSGTITGTLIRVKVDYIVIVEPTSNIVLIPIDKVESIEPA